MRLNSHSRLNLITALLEAIDAGADEALMLDPHGFVSSCNATNFFFVRDGKLMTSTGEYCFNGVTRGNVIRLCQRERCSAASWAIFRWKQRRRRTKLSSPARSAASRRCESIDGHTLPASLPGPVTQRVRTFYEELKDAEAKAGSR